LVLLSEDRAGINDVDNEGCTALHRASGGGHAEVCRALLACELFTEADAKDQHGRTALHHAACDNGSSEADDCQTCLVLSTVERHAWFFKFVVFRAVDERDSNGETALHYSTRAGRVGVTKALCNIVDPHVKDAAGSTVLHGAAARGELEMCKVVLASKSAAGLSSDVDDEGRNALHLAAAARRVAADGDAPGEAAYAEICELILHDPHFGGVAVQDNEGSTALHVAAAGGHLEICRRLLGLDHETTSQQWLKRRTGPATVPLKPPDLEGRTALHRACETGQAVGVVDLLLKTDGDRKVTQNSKYMDFSNWQDNEGRTALHNAAMSGDAKTCELLASSFRFVAIGARDSRGRTACQVAIGPARDVLTTFGEELRVMREHF